MNTLTTRLALVALLVFASSPASAQVNLHLWGGANTASVSGEDAAESLNTISAGLAATVPITATLGIQPGLAWVGKGFVFWDVETQQQFVELTALGRFDIPVADGRVTAHFLAGPALAVRASCDLSYQPDDSEVVTASCDEADFEQKGWDLGVMAGAGLAMDLTPQLGLTVGATLTQGLTNTTNQPDENVKWRVLGLRAGLSYSIR